MVYLKAARVLVGLALVVAGIGLLLGLPAALIAAGAALLIDHLT